MFVILSIVLNPLFAVAVCCCREQLEFLRTLAPRVHVVRGDMDDDDDLPESLTGKQQIVHRSRLASCGIGVTASMHDRVGRMSRRAASQSPAVPVLPYGFHNLLQ